MLFAKILEVSSIFIDGTCNHVKFNERSAEFMLPLIQSQSYIYNAEIYKHQKYDYNYGDHPQNIPVVVGTNLTNYHASKFNLLDNPKIHEPWLTLPTKIDTNIKNKKIIINRTHRYHGNNKFYYDFLKYFNKSDLLFLGLEEEYHSFNKEFGNPNIDYIKTTNILELATLINSIPTFVGNQSLICAIATGLGKNAFIEYCPQAANYIFNRQNINYF
jgi:hypothetical protein